MIGEIVNWLLHDDQKELFEILFACALNLLFLALSALLLWPLDRTMMAFQLAQGYSLFWILLSVATLLLLWLQRMFRLDIDSNFDAYVLSGVVVSGVLQAGWSAFAALTIHSFIDNTPAWIVVVLYLIGVLSCYIAFQVVSAFYGGQIYRLVNLLLALVSFIVFSLWLPAPTGYMDGSSSFFEQVKATFCTCSVYDVQALAS